MNTPSFMPDSMSGTVPGFANPVDDAQTVFRIVLQAFSRPGSFVCLPTLPHPLANGEMSQGMLAMALALCDNNTPLWLDTAADTHETRHHLRFHCAAPVTKNPAEAAFAFISRPETMPRLAAFNPGRADFPDRSATLVIRVDRSVEATGPGIVNVTGPGVKGNEQGGWESFRVGGLPSWFWTDWEENRAAYPLGVDVLFVDASIAASGRPYAAVLGLPRTSRVRACPCPSWNANVKELSACM